MSALKQVRLTPVSTLPDRGELRPKAARGVQTVARPAQLDDLDWLREEYRLKGDRAIATDLRVSVGMVTRARERLGIQSAGAGRRRGLILAPPPALQLPVHERVFARYQHERSLADGPAPSVQLVITRARDTVLAHHDGGNDLIEEALEALAVAALLELDQRQQRRAGP